MTNFNIFNKHIKRPFNSNHDFIFLLLSNILMELKGTRTIMFTTREAKSPCGDIILPKSIVDKIIRLYYY